MLTSLLFHNWLPSARQLGSRISLKASIIIMGCVCIYDINTVSPLLKHVRTHTHTHTYTHTHTFNMTTFKNKTAIHTHTRVGFPCRADNLRALKGVTQITVCSMVTIYNVTASHARTHTHTDTTGSCSVILGEKLKLQDHLEVIRYKPFICFCLSLSLLYCHICCVCVRGCTVSQAGSS